MIRQRFCVVAYTRDRAVLTETVEVTCFVYFVMSVPMRFQPTNGLKHIEMAFREQDGLNHSILRKDILSDTFFFWCIVECTLSKNFVNSLRNTRKRSVRL